MKKVLGYLGAAIAPIAVLALFIGGLHLISAPYLKSQGNQTVQRVKEEVFVVPETKDEIAEIPSPDELVQVLRESRDSVEFRSRVKEILVGPYEYSFPSDVSSITFWQGEEIEEEIPITTLNALGFQKKLFPTSCALVTYDTAVHYSLNSEMGFEKKSIPVAYDGNTIFLKSGKDSLTEAVWGGTLFEYARTRGMLRDSFGIKASDTITITLSVLSSVNPEIILAARDIGFLIQYVALVQNPKNRRHVLEVFWNASSEFPGAKEFLRWTIVRCIIRCPSGKCEFGAPESYKNFKEWLLQEVPSDIWCMTAVGRIRGEQVEETTDLYYGKIQEKIIPPAIK